MSELNDVQIKREDSLSSRRDFLKKAGLAVGAAAALYVVPSVTSVKAAPAYTAVTAVETPTPGNITITGPSGLTLYDWHSTEGCNPQYADIDFEWASVGGAGSYVLKLYSGSNCSGTLQATETTVGTSWDDIGFPSTGDYSWTVEAFSGAGGTGSLLATSGCTNFQLDCNAP